MGRYRKIILILALSLISAGAAFYGVQRVVAELSGGSPESGATSRLKTLADVLVTKTYGSTAAGTWGDWGAMWNRIYSSAVGTFNDAVALGLKNGSAASGDYPQSVGGVDDYNNNNPTPGDAYSKTWITCNANPQTPANPGGNWCGTGRSVAEKQDPNTGLVWSPRISSAATWFVANSCKVPTPGGDGTCDLHGEVACKCVKQTAGNQTGCEAYDDGNWRLPYQKELMQSYIDGSWANLTTAAASYWSQATISNSTQSAWSMNQSHGSTDYSTKTNNLSVRCVR